MFSKSLLLHNNGDSPYLIYRMTYAEVQSYHSTLTVGYVIKNRDEKFKIVLVINDDSIYNNGYTYGLSDNPHYNPRYLPYYYSGSGLGMWSELRIYCDPRIMNLGNFEFSNLYYNSSLVCDGYGPDIIYDASGGYYSLVRSDRDQTYTYDPTAVEEAIIYTYNTYYDAIQGGNNIRACDIIRTVDVSFDYNPNYGLRAEGMLATLTNNNTVLNLNYSSETITLIDVEVSLNQRTNFYRMTVNNTSFERVIEMPSEGLESGTNTLIITYRMSNGSTSQIEKTFVVNTQ